MRFLTHRKSHHKHPKVHLIVCGGGFQPFKGTNYFWQKEYFAMSFERCLCFALMEEAKGTGHAFCSILVPEDRFPKEFCAALAPCRNLAPETPSFKVITFEGRDSTARSATNTRAGKRDTMVSESMGRCSAEETQLIAPLPPSPLPAACAGAALHEHKLQVRSTALLAGSWQQPPKHRAVLSHPRQRHHNARPVTDTSPPTPTKNPCPAPRISKLLPVPMPAFFRYSRPAATAWY